MYFISWEILHFLSNIDYDKNILNIYFPHASIKIFTIPVSAIISWQMCTRTQVTAHMRACNINLWPLRGALPSLPAGNKGERSCAEQSRAEHLHPPQSPSHPACLTNCLTTRSNYQTSQRSWRPCQQKVRTVSGVVSRCAGLLDPDAEWDVLRGTWSYCHSPAVFQMYSLDVLQPCFVRAFIINK